LRCHHFGSCGGCSLQDLSYAGQLRQKTARLRDVLAADASEARGSGVPDVETVGMPVDDDGMPWAFRQKVSFAFGAPAQGQGLAMGHYARGSKRVIPIDECPVHSARGNRIAFALRDRLARAGLTAAGTSRTGILRHILVRTTADDSEAIAMLVVTQNDKSLRTPIRGLLASPERPDGFLLNIHDRPGPFMVGTETIVIEGRSHVRERIGGVSFLVSPTAFFQTNVRAASDLVRIVSEAVGDRQRVLDLFSGSGLFTLPLATRGARVVAVEENRDAVRDAGINLRFNHIPDGRVQLITASVEEAWPRLGRMTFDAVVLDPPRDGCSDAVLDAVFTELAPPRVVYVSCNPEALARELPGIRAAGYAVTRAHAVDMFPHTDHIETVVQLERLR